MDQTREDRMRSRMRGAARHQVQDADFGDLFAIPALAPEPEPEHEPEQESSSPPAAASPETTPAPASVKRTGPNTSAKRRRLNSGGVTVSPALAQSQLPSQSTTANRSSKRVPSPRSGHAHPDSLDNAPVPADEAEAVTISVPRSLPSSQRTSSAARSSAPGSNGQRQAPPQPSPLVALRAEEVSESPTDAPGSGHRRRLRASGARDSSALLQSALQSADNDTGIGFLQSSSPLSRKSRKSAAGTLASARSTRTGLRRSPRISGSPDVEAHELSSDLPVNPEENVGASVLAEEPSLEESVPEVPETVVVEPSTADEDEVAQEIDDREAVRHLGRKRPHRQIRVASLELSPDEAAEEPVAKRQRPAAPARKKSPPKQRQPKIPRARPKKSATTRKKKDDDESRPPVPVKIQRFTRLRHRADGDSDDEDILNMNMPHANRSGVNAIDVLSSMCEEIISSSVIKVKDSISNAQDAATKKEHRIKLRALEAFQGQLRTRLLEHTIALDQLFALKKRVRDAQREKLKLRERIMQIRAEREQVALRMDALRAKHDEDSKEALHNINLSAAMHDIDLAIEQGRAAPELSAKDQKIADLANLELLISRVTEQACDSGPGGVLKQIKGFNAFLERTAAVL